MNSIIPIPGDINTRKSEIDNLNFLQQSDNVYVMDNHLAAGWCWLQELDPDEEYCFFHIDRHEDLRGGVNIEFFQCLKDNPHLTIEEYTALSFHDETRQGKVFLWDNYIKQIQRLFPQWFSKCYFACPNIVDDPPHYTRYPLNIVYNAAPLELYHSIDYWIESDNKKFIVNLDIDYFFDDERMLLFSEEYISTFAKNLNKAMDDVAVLTIALSPECCGGWENSIEAFNIIAKEIDAIDINPFEK